MANKYNREKANQARQIQRYAETVLGMPKNTQVTLAVDAIVKATGCDRSRIAVFAAIAGGGISQIPAVAKKKKRERISTPAVMGSEFYDTWAWKEARYEALKRHGRTCQCCGWKPSDGGSYLVVDHIKPRRFFPALELDQDNLQVLCNDCNKGKSYRHQDDFR